MGDRAGLARGVPRARRRRARPDALNLPGIGRFLRWRHARTALQALLLVVAGLVLLDGFLGPPLAPANLAGILPWIHWRGLVVLALLVAGNLFCLACPFMLPRRLAKRLWPAGRAWPRLLRSKWVAIGLLLLFFWAYEAFDLWTSPWLTAWVVLAYFAAAFAVDALFKGAAFCKYVCPIGQFNFIGSLVSPVEVAVRRPAICAACATKDCIVGRELPVIGRRPAPGRQNGCELWLFQPRKVGNLDCTFCLDCVHACPHANIGLLARLPGRELWEDASRSGVGRISRRPDLAALVLVLTFGAFVNAFGMVRPVYALIVWLGGALGTTNEPLVLLLILAVGLVGLPLLGVGLAAAASRALADARRSLVATATRSTYALVPLGIGMWAGHYSFHFLSGALTIVPVVQTALADLTGVPLLGAPAWQLGPLLPLARLPLVETTALEAGLLGSLYVAYRLARAEHGAGGRAWRAALPWFVLILALFAAGVWLFLQPMEMRGTMLGG